MRSRLVERLGVQAPQIKHLPPDVVSLAAAEEAIELGNAYGFADGNDLSESQEETLRAGMAERRDGTWSATTVADFKPRQGGGKSDTINVREGWGLLIGGEPLIIHTAHEFPTANESFLRMVAVFEAWDDLRSKVSRVRYANGEQGIELRTGQRLKYRARTGGSGRGFTKAALVVYDEAQHLQAEHVAASGPARLANPNSQSWYAGSGGLASSKQAWRLRRRALAGDGGRLAYVENTAETIAMVAGKIVTDRPVDLAELEEWAADKDRRALANPGYNRWVTDESLEGLLGELGAALFVRECMNVWEPDPEADDDEGAITKAAWVDLHDDTSKIAGPRTIALDVSPDYQWATFAAAGRRDDTLVHLEAFDTRPGTGWIVAAAAALAARWAVPIRVQDGSPAGAFVADMRQQGVVVDVVSAREHAAAIGMLLTGIENRRLRIMPSATLTTAASNADLRPYGDVELWARRNAKVNITPIVAVTLALGGVPEAAEFYMPRRLR